MNPTDLFDRMASELAPSGAVVEHTEGRPVLSVDGRAFARLTDNGAEVYMPEGSPARKDALDRWTTSEAGDWVCVPENDLSMWPTLIEQAFQSVRA